MFELTRRASIVAIGVALSWSAACAPGSGAQDTRELTVYAAASLRDALVELAAVHAADRPHVKLVFNFGASSDLARQILAADQADVFFSADEIEMDRVASARRLVEGSRQSLLSNQLVVVEPIDDPLEPADSQPIFRAPFTPEQLASERVVRLSLAHPDSVPAGRYARAWLETAGVWGAVAERVLPAVDVRAALAAVEAGGAQAGIVYATDAARSRRVRVVHRVPADEGPRIAYPIALVAGRAQEGDARELVAFLCGARARAVFEKHGFTVLGGA